MKDKFTSSLTGKKWWKPFLCFVILLLAVNIPQELSSMHYTDQPTAMEGLSKFLFSLVMVGLMAVIEAVFIAILYRIVYASISIRNKTFAFTGKAGDLIKILLPGFFLTMITLGFYIPRFEKRLVGYIAEHSELDGERFHFMGTTKKLYKYYFLSCVLPVAIWIAGFVLVVMAAGIPTEKSAEPSGQYMVFVMLSTIALLIMLIPFIVLNYKWMMNIRWKDQLVSWKINLWPSCAFVLGQVALTIVTVGIYWPVMMIKTYRYFAEKTVILDSGQEKARFGFEGKTGRGFGLLWGQSLLCVITLGIYSPWATAKIANYFITESFIEDKQARITA
jgi:uncharacterized membrane protein YjgN (DUF898 family)